MSKFLITIFIFLANLNCIFADNKSIKTHGCVQLDYMAWKKTEIECYDPCFFFKEANIIIKGSYSNDLNCCLNFKFCPQKIEFLIKEAYINIKKPHFEIKIGKIHPFYDLENITLPTNRLFMEKASLQGFEEQNLFGLMLNLKSSACNFFYYLMTPEFSPLTKGTHTSKLSSFLRCFITIDTKDNLWHFGINYKEILRNQYDDSKYTSISIIDTPFFLQPYSYSRTHYTSLPTYRVIGYELIAILNSLCIQAEVSFSRAGWKDFDPELYHSINIQAGYILTGEQHAYDYYTGVIKNPQPKKNLGILELTFRYSLTDTTSKNSLLSGVCKTDSKKNTLNAGLNWYLDDNIQIQLNYAYESIIYRLIADKEIQSIGLGIRFSF